MTTVSHLINEATPLQFKFFGWAGVVDVRALPISHFMRVSEVIDSQSVGWYEVAEVLESPDIDAEGWKIIYKGLGKNARDWTEKMLFFSLFRVYKNFFVCKIIALNLLNRYTLVKLFAMLAAANGLDEYLRFALQARFETLRKRRLCGSGVIELVRTVNPNNEVEAYFSIYQAAKNSFGSLNGVAISFDNLYSVLTYPQFSWLVSNHETIYSYWLGLFGTIVGKVLPPDSGGKDKKADEIVERMTLFQEFQIVIKKMQTDWRSSESEQKIKAPGVTYIIALYDLFRGAKDGRSD